jgi:hypothetical protein
MLNDTSAPRSHRVLLAALVLLCVALRWTGIEYGLPHLSNLDERVYLSQYLDLREPGGVTQPRPRHAAYPDLWMHAAALVPRADPGPPATDLERQRAQASADIAYLRRWVALLSSIVVVGTWLVARRFMSSGWSLAAAALAGLSVLNLCHSTQARPHAIECTAILFAVAAAIDVARKGTWRASVVAALVTGAAIAVLQSGVAALFPFVVAHALRVRTDGARALGRLAVAAVIVVAIALFAYPGIVDGWTERDGNARGFLGEHTVNLADFRGQGSKAVVLAFWNHDPLLLVACAAAIMGVAARFRSQRKLSARIGPELCVVLAFVVPFLVVLGLYKHTYYRFVLPLFPFAAVFTVHWMQSMRRIGQWICGIVLLAQLGLVIQVVRLHRAPDTAERAAAWLAEHVERETTRVWIAPTTDVPLLRTSAALKSEGASPRSAFAPWIDYQRSLANEVLDAHGFSILDLPLRFEQQRALLTADPDAFVRGLGASYLVLEVFDDSERPVLSALRRAAQARGTLLASFVPEGAQASDPHGIEPYASAEYYAQDRFVWRILDAEALGPYLEIYRFEP